MSVLRAGTESLEIHNGRKDSEPMHKFLRTALLCVATVALFASCSGETDEEARQAGGGAPSDNNDTFSAADRIRLNSSYSAQIATSTDVDYVVFNVPSGSTDLLVFTEGGTNTSCSLYFPSRDLADANDNGGSGTNCRIEATIGNRTSADWYVSVNGENASRGDYVLHVRDVTQQGGGQGSSDGRNDSFDDAESVRSNSSIRAALDPAGDLDYYRFNVSGGAPEDRLAIFTEGDTDTFCSLYNARRELLAQDDDGAEGVNCGLSGTNVNGTFFIRIRGFSERTTGDYTLNIIYPAN